MVETRKLEHYQAQPFDLSKLAFIPYLYLPKFLCPEKDVPADFFAVQARFNLLRFNKLLLENMGSKKSDVAVKKTEKWITRINRTLLAWKNKPQFIRTFILDSVATMYLAENFWKQLSHKEKERIKSMRQEGEALAKKDWVNIFRPILKEKSYVLRLIRLKTLFDTHGEALSKWLPILHRGRFELKYEDPLTPKDITDTHLHFRFSETRLIHVLKRSAKGAQKGLSEYRVIEFVRELESIFDLPSDYPGDKRAVHERIRTRYHSTKQRLGISD